MNLPSRIFVTYERIGEVQPDQETAEGILMKMFSSIGYEHYMTHDKTNLQTGNPERTLEFVERF